MSYSWFPYRVFSSILNIACPLDDRTTVERTLKKEPWKQHWTRKSYSWKISWKTIMFFSNMLSCSNEIETHVFPDNKVFIMDNFIVVFIRSDNRYRTWYIDWKLFSGCRTMKIGILSIGASHLERVICLCMIHPNFLVTNFSCHCGFHSFSDTIWWIA